MDNLTHALVGAALARAGLDKRTPLATVTLVVAANAPDVDVLSFTRGPYFALSFRRGITHGIPAMLVLPFVVAGAMLGWDHLVRRRTDPEGPRATWGALLLLAAIGVATHPVLDWMNVYGMRWWLPFDGRWSYGDSLFIVDPWLWLLLGAAAALGGPREGTLAALWALLAGVTTWAVVSTGVVGASAKVVWAFGVVAITLAWIVGRPHGGMGRARLAQTLGVVALLYVAAMVGTHHAARRDVRAQLSGGLSETQDEVMISPLPALPFRSDVLVATTGGYLRGVMDWTKTPALDLSLEGALPRIEAGPGITDGEAIEAVTAARVHPDVALYLVWSRFPAWSVRRAGDGFDVSVGDARYPGRGGGLSGLTVRISATR